MSKNATTMVIGAYGYNEYTGYVKVYHKVDGESNWTQLGPTIYGNVNSDYLGWSVEITADGRTIICGYPGDMKSRDRPGYVRVFKLVSDSDIGIITWEQIGQNITGEANGDLFGGSNDSSWRSFQ